MPSTLFFRLYRGALIFLTLVSAAASTAVAARLLWQEITPAALVIAAAICFCYIGVARDLPPVLRRLSEACRTGQYPA